MLRAQFTYTASRRPGPFDTGAGWKVSAISKVGPVSDDVIRAAARNVGGFVPPPLPELASKADVDALPHCLRLDVLDGPEPLACLSSIVAAGPDYSGRPNTFAHGLVVSGDGLADGRGCPLRPADLWDAALWQRPLGAQAAEETLLDEHLRDLTRGPLDAAALEAFTRAHPDQRELVLAAVERFLGGAGPLVVVGDGSFSSVATWLHLAGRLLLPTSAWRLPFSTYERLRDPRTATGWRFAVVGVPAADAAAAAALPGSRFTVLRDDEKPVRAGLGRWTLHDGAPLTAGPWARLAESVISAEFLPVVTDQVEALAAAVGNSTADRPMWALGAAVLLDDDLAEFFGADAAEVAAAHWPARVDAEEVLERVLECVERHAAPGSDAAARIRERLTSDPDSPLAQRALLRPVLAALETPADFERLAHTLPQRPIEVAPALRTDLGGAVADALGRVPQADDPVGALLAVAAVMDHVSSPLELRLRAVELARELVVPRLVEPAADPVRRGWPPVPSWLWDSLTRELAATPQLEHGIELPGENLSAATHEWLGSLSLPAGELTAEALRGTGPVEWERAAYRLYVRRDRDVTPLERAAAFLGTVRSGAVNDGTAIDRWASRAADDAYPRNSLDVPTATVLMDAIPAEVPFAVALATVLQRTPPSPETRAAAVRLHEREVVPRNVEHVVERHRRFEEPAATSVPTGGTPVTVAGDPAAPSAAAIPPGEVLVTDRAQLLHLLTEPQRLGAPRSAWIPVAEALLRVDVRVLPMEKLPQATWEDAMPWGDGWARLDAEQTDPGSRTLLAAHLLCRGARARWWLREDWAAGWLTEKGEERNTVWAETIAGRLLLRGDPRIGIEDLVRVLTEQAPRKPSGTFSDGGKRDDAWREDALTWARRLAGSKPRPSPVPRAR
ncbi:GAP1-N2 domain-containing protein [Geodermatophilus sp. SYSU D00698]